MRISCCNSADVFNGISACRWDTVELLKQFSYNASSVRSDVIVHKDRSVNQWMIINIGYNVCVKKVVAV